MYRMCDSLEIERLGENRGSSKQNDQYYKGSGLGGGELTESISYLEIKMLQDGYQPFVMTPAMIKRCGQSWLSP